MTAFGNLYATEMIQARQTDPNVIRLSAQRLGSCVATRLSGRIGAHRRGL